MDQTPAGSPLISGTHILIAEDHPATRKLLENMLKNAGFAVTVAANGEEALDSFRREFTPIVLMDWMMPELNGLELCKALRHSTTQGYVYILFLTAKDSKADVVKALEAGADDYITKPFDRDELLARIKTGLRVLDLERSLKQATEEIRILSLTDPLTGIYNRAYLNERLPHEVKRSVRYEHPLQLVMCDIDHFKAVNDLHGHQAGDEVLRGFASLLKGSIGQNLDWVARYGWRNLFLSFLRRMLAALAGWLKDCDKPSHKSGFGSREREFASLQAGESPDLIPVGFGKASAPTPSLPRGRFNPWPNMC